MTDRTNGLGRLYWQQRAPGLDLPRPGGAAQVWVRDAKGLAIPSAEVRLMRVDRQTLDVIEDLGGQRTDNFGRAMFALPATAAQEALVFVAEAPGYGRQEATARPGMRWTVTLGPERGGFAPSAVVTPPSREMFGYGDGLSAMPEDRFLVELARAAGLNPAEAGTAAALWRQRSHDRLVVLVGPRLGLSAEQRSTLRKLLDDRDTDGALALARDAARPFWLRPLFYVPAAFFAAGIALRRLL